MEALRLVVERDLDVVVGNPWAERLFEDRHLSRRERRTARNNRANPHRPAKPRTHCRKEVHLSVLRAIEAFADRIGVFADGIRVFPGCQAGDVTRRRHLATVLALALVGTTRAMPPTMPRVVPDDLVAAYFVAGPDRAQQPTNGASTFELVSFLADRAREVGLLSLVGECNRMWIDTFVSLSTVLEHPHAVVLFDVRAAPRADGGHQLAGLRAALISHTDGANEDLERRIQHLLNTYTNSNQTILSNSVKDGQAFFTLRDRRLPAWARITWGPLGEYYVVAVGDGSYDDVAKTIAAPGAPGSLAHDQWFAKAFAQAGGARASLVWYIRFDRLRDNADPLLAEKVERVQAALRLGNVERNVWAFGFDGRAVEISSVCRRGDRSEAISIAGRRFLATLNEPVIPAEAGRYAIVDCRVGTVLHSVCEAYLAAKSLDAQRRSRDFWRRLDANAGVSLQRDIFSQLVSPVVIHDYPRHALRLPFAWTILARIRAEPAVLRGRIDRWLEGLREELTGHSLLQLRHDDDGVWYVQYGLVGPALLVADRWLIISFSPQAVRRNIALLASTPQPVSDGVGERTEHP